MKRKHEKKRAPLKTLTLLVAVVTVLMFLSAGLRIWNYGTTYRPEADVREYISGAERDRYGWLYETALDDMAKGTVYSAEVEEYRALAFFYENAVLEHAYRTVGEEEKADEFARRMDVCRAQLGALAPKAERVLSRISDAQEPAEEIAGLS